MAIQIQPGERDPKRIVDSIIQLNQGRQDSVGDVTLTPNAAFTVVDFINCSIGCRVFLSPRTASAAAAVATTYISQINQKAFVISHANSAVADRTFSFVCIGG